MHLDSHGEKSPHFVCRINFNSYSREPKLPHNSEVLKLLREQEAGLSRPSQENRNNYNSNESFWRSFWYCLYFPWRDTEDRTYMYHFTLSFGIMTDNHVALAGNLNISIPNFLLLSHWSHKTFAFNTNPIFVPQIKVATGWIVNVSLFTSLRINFSEDPKLDLSNSETLKLVQQLDNNKEPDTEPGLWRSFIIFWNLRF